MEAVKACREAHRRVITQYLQRIEAAKDESMPTVFNTILKSIQKKQECVRDTDQKIIDLLQPTEIEAEMLEADDYHLELEIQISLLEEYRLSEGFIPERETPHGNTAQQLLIPGLQTSQQTVSSSFSQSHKLPKLSLPTFSGDLLLWQTFWDCYDSAVHSNPSLTDVQKFTYLKSQLEGAAASAIAGFALTNANYARAVSLLQERFGQTHKIVQAYMQALLEQPPPSNTLSSLQRYYDQLESFIRGLESLGQKHLCFNCLGIHQVCKCRSNFRCCHCQRKHHTSICDQKPFPTDPPAQERERPHAAVLHFSSQPQSKVLLKTAVAQVSHKQYSADAKILFDEGAQRSFITEKLADRLQLPHENREIIHLTSFGDSNQTIRYMDTATIYLHTDFGRKIPIKVLIAPTIAVPLRNIQRDVADLPYIRGLKLAHPLTEDDTFEITLLIGADHFWDIVQNRIVRGNGPTAVSSKIGYLLSGPLPVPATHSEASHILNILTTPPDVHDVKFFSIHLQHTSRIYDPLGLLSPVTIRAKILLQKIWQLKYSWDAVLPENIHNKWTSLATDLNKITSMKLPRYYFSDLTSADDSSSSEVTSLHIFVDASTLSFGSTAYLCTSKQSTLIMAKTRVAPLKKLTLPRLELMAALVGARAANHLQSTCHIDPEHIHMWSDNSFYVGHFI